MDVPAGSCHQVALYTLTSASVDMSPVIFLVQLCRSRELVLAHSTMGRQQQQQQQQQQLLRQLQQQQQQQHHHQHHLWGRNLQVQMSLMMSYCSRCLKGHWDWALKSSSSNSSMLLLLLLLWQPMTFLRQLQQQLMKPTAVGLKQLLLQTSGLHKQQSRLPWHRGLSGLALVLLAVALMVVGSRFTWDQRWSQPFSSSSSHQNRRLSFASLYKTKEVLMESLVESLVASLRNMRDVSSRQMAPLMAAHQGKSQLVLPLCVEQPLLGMQQVMELLTWQQQQHHQQLKHRML
jgi:hypothetical protein